MAQPLRHPATLDSDSLLAQCHTQRSRRSGPGGQHRNKVETAVVLTHQPTGVKGEASERRSQAENQRRALLRLRVNLALQVRHPVAPDSEPGPLWQSRCRGGRIAVNPVHSDFPALLAEALDVLHAHDMDVPAAAKTLRCTASQLIKLLKLEPRALQAVNDRRRQRNLRPLQ